MRTSRLITRCLLIAGLLTLNSACSHTTTVTPAADLPLPAPTVTVAPSVTAEPPVSTDHAVTAGPALTAFPQTQDGAAAFTEGWFEALNSAYLSGDTSSLEAVTDSECTACADYRRRQASFAARGGTVTEGPFTISRLSSTEAETGVALVTFEYQVSGENPSPARAALRWTGQHWVMGEIGQ